MSVRRSTDMSAASWDPLPAGNPTAAGDSLTWPGLWKTSAFSSGGTFGGASVALEGSDDGQTWVALSPPALTAAGAFAAVTDADRRRFVRPLVSGGDATTAITVQVAFSGGRYGVQSEGNGGISYTRLT